MLQRVAATVCWLAVTIQPREAIDASVQFVVGESEGEDYRRLIEPMPQYEQAVPVCPSSQVATDSTM